MIQVKGYPNLVRDPENNAIINLDIQGIEQAKANKEARKRARQNFEKRIDTLEKDIGEIKDAINALIQKL